MKRILFLACTACAIFLLTSCEKKYKSGVVTFYGNIVDDKTGSPVPVAQIKISGEGGEGVTSVSTVTGSDGAYEIDVTLPAGETKSFSLYIDVNKRGYYFDPYDSFLNVTRDMVGKRIQRSFSIEKKY